MMRHLLIIALLTTCALAQNVSQYVPSVYNPGVTSGGTITLGDTTVTGGTQAPGTNGMIERPVLTYSGASGYTLKSFQFYVSTASGQMIPAIAASGSTGCPTGASLCAGTVICKAAAITPIAGLNTVNAASFSACGTLAANTYYFPLLMASNGTGAVNTSPGPGAGSNGQYCSGTGFYMLTASNASFAVPASIGTQTEPSGANCPAISITLNCVGSCGTATPPWTLFTYNGNTSGTAVSAANLKTGSVCTNGQFSIATAGITYDNTQLQGFASPGPVCNGTNYQGGTLSVKRTAAQTTQWTYGVNSGYGGSAAADMYVWIYNTGNVEVNGDLDDLWAFGGNENLTWGSHGGATDCASSSFAPCYKVEISGVNTTKYHGIWKLTTGAWYLTAIHFVAAGGDDQATMYDTTGAAQTNHDTSANCPGAETTSTICAFPSAATSVYPSGYNVGCNGSCDTVDSGTYWYASVAVDPTGSSWSNGGALAYLFFPDSPAVIGPTYAQLVRKGVIKHAEIRNGHWWSYALNRDLGPASVLARSVSRD